MCTFFRTETQDVAQNLINNFFLTLTVRKKKWKNMGLWAYFLKKNKAMHAELNERAETAASSYSTAVDFWNYLFGVCD